MIPSKRAEPFDLLLVGGGLQNNLIALAALAEQPQRRIALIEQQPELGGNHTWCAHPADVPESAWRWLEPLVECRWPGYEVRFPGLSRTLDGPYTALTSRRFARHVPTQVTQAPGATLMLETQATSVHARHVELADGRRVEGQLVVDARGPDPETYRGWTGYQKFLGLEIRFARPHGRTLPLLMDATVPQTEGFRFFYCLPLDDRRMLVEDTCFSLRPALDLDDAPVLAYAEQYAPIADVERREHGVLPMPWQSPNDPPCDSPLRAGYGGGFFHPATGYSLPVALRLALHLAAHSSEEALGKNFQRWLRHHRQQVRYAEHLNYLLFHGFDAPSMWRIFRRFYTLPAPLIHRFYALSMGFADRARILVGAPLKGFRWSAALKAAGRLA